MEEAERISCSWTVDAEGCLRSVGGHWSEFASDNRGGGLKPSDVIGRRLLDFIQGSGVREVYRSLMDRARERGEPLTVALNCASPDTERILDLTIRSLDDGGFEFRTRPRRVRPIPHNPILEAASGKSGEGLMEVCSWCKRVRADEGGWQFPEDAYRELEQLITNEAFEITHGMCEDCYERLEAA